MEEEIIIVFIFLYEELNSTTINILTFIDNSNINEIIKIQVNKDDKDTHNWLLHNTKGIIIDKFPVFLIAQTGKKTIIKDGTINETRNIVNIIKKIPGR